MAKRESVKFFTRFLLLSVLSIVNIVICLSIVGNGAFLGIIAVLLAVSNVFFLIFMAVRSLTMLFKHLVDKDKKKFELLYVFNVFFTALVTGLYLFFYFMIIMGVLIILLPFIA